MRIVTGEQLSDEAMEVLEQAGCEVVTDPMLEACEGADALICTGDTPLPETAYEGGSIRAVVFCNRDQTAADLRRLTRAGILALMPKSGEAASIADYCLKLLLDMARDRKEGAFELRGRSLGFLGFNRVAAEIAQRARGFDMDLYCADTSLNRGSALRYNVEPLSMVDLFVICDFVVVLVPLSSDTRGLIGKDEIQLLKSSAGLICLTDPGVFRWDELVRCLDWEYLTHFAIDLPRKNARLAREIEPWARVSVAEAANTLDARRGNEVEMARNLVEALSGGEVETAVNAPETHAQDAELLADWAALARMLGQFMGRRLTHLSQNAVIEASGFMPATEQALITAQMLNGLAQGLDVSGINVINARAWAAENDLAVRYEIRGETEHARLCLSVITARGRYQVAGDLASGDVQIIQVDEYLLRARPTEHVLLVPHVNRPGLVGQVGMLMGEENVNISGMVLGHKAHDLSTALMWITIDQAPDEALAEKSRALPSVLSIEYIHLV